MPSINSESIMTSITDQFINIIIEYTRSYSIPKAIINTKTMMLTKINDNMSILLENHAKAISIPLFLCKAIGPSTLCML